MGGTVSRRRVIGTSAGVTGLVGILSQQPKAAVARSQPRLYVFLPTLVRQSVLRALLEESLKGVHVTVFGRFFDFRSAVNTHRPEAALSLDAGLVAVGLSPALQGTGENGPSEPYLVLTAKASMDVTSLNQATLGVVDIVGRRALPSLVQNLLNLREAPRVRRVLKIADLLPLLSLGLADGIVLPARLSSTVERSSQLPLRAIRPDSAQLGRAAVAFPQGTSQPLIERGLRGLMPKSLEVLGVTSWEAR